MTQPTRFDPTGESNIGAPLSRATLLFLLASLLLLSIPCHAATYTVCNAGPPACTFNNVQDTINAAAFGDQILLQAGQTFSGFQLKYKPGPDGNPIVITTTAQAFLPVPGTRITPAYSSGSSPVTARIQGWLGPTVTTQNGTSACPGSATSCPAHDYTLVGLEIVPGASNGAAYDHVRIGPVDNSEKVTTADGEPYNITLDRLYVHQARLGQVRRCITPHGRNIVIENSWICDCKMRGVDSQAIVNWNGVGPVTVTNNYLDASTEIVNLGGAMPTIPNLIPSNVTLSYNHFYRPDYYLYSTWASSSWYGQGKFIAPTTSNGFQYLAQNSGTTGATEPVWPTAAGATVTDGTVVWAAEVNSAGSRWLVKNLFESKSSDTLQLDHNVFERNPLSGQGGVPIVLTVRTSQSGLWAHIFNTTFTNNVIRDTNLGFSILGRDDLDPLTASTWNPNNSYGTLKNLVVRNNLIYRTGGPQWGGGQGALIGLGWAIQNAWFDHNTLDGKSSDVLGLNGQPGNQILFTNNLSQPGAYGIFEDNAKTGCNAINYYFCNDPSLSTYPNANLMCPGAVKANVIPNLPVASSDPCTGSTAIPAGNWSIPWSSLGFEDPANGDYRLPPTSQFIAAGTDGKPLGADTTQLPLIGNLTVTPAATAATFTYTAPNSIACTLQVSTDREFGTVAPDVDPTKFPRADSDQFHAAANGLDKTFVVGAPVTEQGLDGQNYSRALAPNTTYWYWLACGGEGKYGSFTTLPPPVTVRVSPASATIQAGQSQQFVPTVTGTANTAVTWSVAPDLGAISAGGLYTAPASVATTQTVTVTATSQVNPASTTSASVAITPAPDATATSAGADLTTQGNWNAAYGSDGYSVFESIASYPSYATVIPSGKSDYVWAASTIDVRALRNSDAVRIAGTWYSSSTFTIDLNITDGNAHRVALYCLDWDRQGRMQTVSLVDSTGAVLDSRSVSNFSNGVYVVWNVSGHVQIHVTRQAGPLFVCAEHVRQLGGESSLHNLIRDGFASGGGRCGS